MRDKSRVRAAELWRAVLSAASFLTFLFVLTGLAVQGAYGAEKITPFPGGDARTDDNKRKYFTDLKLITNDGREVRFYSDLLRDKVVVINSYYLNCATVCPLQNKVLSDMQKLLGDHMGRDIFIISTTVDPANDKPELVREYAKVFNAGKGWVFLTGKKENVDWVNYRLGYYTENPETHMTVYLLGNVKTGHWMKMKPDASARALADNLLKLLKEGK